MTQAAALSPEYVLLGFLNQQPAHGYDLHERIEAELGQIWHRRCGAWRAGCVFILEGSICLSSAMN